MERKNKTTKPTIMRTVDYDAVQMLERQKVEGDLKFSADIRKSLLEYLKYGKYKSLMCVPSGAVLRHGISKSEFKEWMDAIGEVCEIEHNYIDDSFIFKPKNPQLYATQPPHPTDSRE